ncbi:biotin-dependent carboxyltransferase family protein [Algoriphagus sp.]|uniref:5-oxoprolinase subunit C family protein n=1 Tax=Algoriphagus sp. TaxID=1872435 RepID=UPI0025D89150|nr:biotin-dependent carboxyltransferase family protein [Algoriphagus sp.]
MNKRTSYFTILKSGPGTSIQDLGRIGFGQYGIPVSGAMDVTSMKWVNHLLKNSENDAVLEVSQPGFKIKFEYPTTICIAGAKSLISINDRTVASEGLLSIDYGDVLEIGPISLGARIYLGIKNGIDIPYTLDSKSSYSGITKLGMLNKGNQISFSSDQSILPFYRAKVKFPRDWMETKEIEVYPGAEWKELKKEAQSQILNTSFTISNQQNRMAFQLEERIPNELEELATAPVYPGTVQLTSGGKLIILMKDAQVTGGYPRILQLSEYSISQLAQKRPNDKITFILKEIIF